MKMINKIADPVDGVIPRTIGILGVENEIQIPLRRLLIIVIREKLRCAQQQECSVSGSIDDSPSSVERSIRAAAGGRRCFKVLDFKSCMPGNGSEDFLPFLPLRYFERLKESLVNVRCCRDQGGILLDYTTAGDPIKRVAPGIFFESRTTGLF